MTGHIDKPRGLILARDFLKIIEGQGRIDGLSRRDDRTQAGVLIPGYRCKKRPGLKGRFKIVLVLVLEKWVGCGFENVDRG